MTHDGCLTFHSLNKSGLQHFFTLRGCDDGGIPPRPESPVPMQAPLVRAEQIHGNGVAMVDLQNAGQTIPGVDALITRSTGLALVIRVADCCPVYFYDCVQRVIGLAHSGRRGTLQNIAGATLNRLKNEYGSRPEDLTVVLGPCIRPPHYEVDFAAEIRRQLVAEGVVHFEDCGLNTASDSARFYAYRMEKGNTGRHHAVLRMI